MKHLSQKCQKPLTMLLQGCWYSRVEILAGTDGIIFVSMYFLATC